MMFLISQGHDNMIFSIVFIESYYYDSPDPCLSDKTLVYATSEECVLLVPHKLYSNKILP